MIPLVQHLQHHNVDVLFLSVLAVSIACYVDWKWVHPKKEK